MFFSFCLYYTLFPYNTCFFPIIHLLIHLFTNTQAERTFFYYLFEKKVHKCFRAFVKNTKEKTVFLL